jgi:hypothetical protein|nr:MAG TPA: hypothetical protein [Caudoviricetes sp.]
MELFVSDEMMAREDTGISTTAYFQLKYLIKEQHDTFFNISKTTSAMLGRVPNKWAHKKDCFDRQFNDCWNNIKSIFGSNRLYLFCAYPSVESFIVGEHKGSVLLGKKMTSNHAVMQVAREENGLRWYVSDRPFEDNTLRRITIDNKGSGYFEYFGPDAPNGSDYYIDQFKEW